ASERSVSGTIQKEGLAVLVDGLYGERGTALRVDQNGQQRSRAQDTETARSGDRVGTIQGGLGRRAHDFRCFMRRISELAQFNSFGEQPGKPPAFYQAPARLL